VRPHIPVPSREENIYQSHGGFFGSRLPEDLNAACIATILYLIDEKALIPKVIGFVFLYSCGR
jgi:hypothetical protein